MKGTGALAVGLWSTAECLVGNPQGFEYPQRLNETAEKLLNFSRATTEPA
jgi:hypothetical protein